MGDCQNRIRDESKQCGGSKKRTPFSEDAMEINRPPDSLL